MWRLITKIRKEKLSENIEYVVTPFSNASVGRPI